MGGFTSTPHTSETTFSNYVLMLLPDYYKAEYKKKLKFLVWILGETAVGDTEWSDGQLYPPDCTLWKFLCVFYKVKIFCLLKNCFKSASQIPLFQTILLFVYAAVLPNILNIIFCSRRAIIVALMVRTHALFLFLLNPTLYVFILILLKSYFGHIA